ncbi:MAG: hypothetical protein AAGA64_11930 [Bacteroidota bacterium]
MVGTFSLETEYLFTTWIFQFKQGTKLAAWHAPSETGRSLAEVTGVLATEFAAFLTRPRVMILH